MAFFEWPDTVVVIIYLAIVLGVALWVSGFIGDLETMSQQDS